MINARLIISTGVHQVDIPAAGVFSNALWVGELGDGLIRLEGVMTAASIGFTMSESPDGGAYYPVMSESDPSVPAQIASPVVDKWYKLPKELEGAGSIRVWSQIAEVDTPQANGLTAILLMKE